MKVKLIKMDDLELVNELQFSSMEEANNFIEFIARYGIQIELDDFDHTITFDAVQNAIVIYIEAV